MRHPDYLSVSSMVDRHGKTRWRLRRSGHKDVMLPGEPHSPEFEKAYQAAILGRSGAIVQMPGAACPKSLKAAYRILKSDNGWGNLDPKSKIRYQQTIERILSVPVGGGKGVGDGPIEELRRTHVKAILATFRHAPHMERVALLCLRKLIAVALDEEWIDVDPTYNMSRSPQTDGHKTWPLEMMERYERKWPIGTRQRTAYALALWLGNRVSDVARLKWSDRTTKHFMDGDTLHSVEGFEIVQFKGRKRGKSLFLPMTPMLEFALWPLTRRAKTVLTTTRGQAYTDGSLTKMMAIWCHEADIPAADDTDRPLFVMSGRQFLKVCLWELRYAALTLTCPRRTFSWIRRRSTTSAVATVSAVRTPITLPSRSDISIIVGKSSRRRARTSR